MRIDICRDVFLLSCWVSEYHHHPHSCHNHQNPHHCHCYDPQHHPGTPSSTWVTGTIRHAHRIICMRDGKVVESGPPKDLSDTSKSSCPAQSFCLNSFRDMASQKFRDRFVFRHFRCKIWHILTPKLLEVAEKELLAKQGYYWNLVRRQVGSDSKVDRWHCTLSCRAPCLDRFAPWMIYQRSTWSWTNILQKMQRQGEDAFSKVNMVLESSIKSKAPIYTWTEGNFS